MSNDWQHITKLTESALFKPTATRADLEKLCAAAKTHGFHSVCVNSSRVALAYALLEDTEVRVTALIGFPLGATDSDVKRYETEVSVDNGAHEIELALNLGLLADGEDARVLRELRDVVEAADDRPVKVALDMHAMTEAEVERAARLVLNSGAHCICTHTGFGTSNPLPDDVKRLRSLVGEKFGVKAGGARGQQLASALIESGANRIGTLGDALVES